METIVPGLALVGTAFSVAALCLAGWVAAASAPARIRSAVDDVQSRLDRVEAAWEAERAAMGSILDSIQSVAEDVRKQRHRQSSQASRDRATGPQPGNSRAEQLAFYRHRAGLGQGAVDGGTG